MSSLRAVISVLSVSHILISLSTAQPWGYEYPVGPANWSVSYPKCGGQRQSPINIVSSSAVYDSSLSSLQFLGYDQANGHSTTVNFTNNGHSVSLSFTPSTNAVGAQYKIKDGGLSQPYVLDNIHFHWGPDDEEGSEHHLDGHEYPLEVHFVHHRQDLGSVKVALNYSDGLAVVGVFVNISTTDNPNFDAILDDLASISHAGDLVSMSTTFVPSTLLPTDMTTFYRYLGSLTSPGCSEAVIWTVYKNTIPISSAQLARFRTIYENKANSLPNVPLTENFRPVQPLNGRTVSTSVNLNAATTTPATNTPKTGESKSAASALQSAHLLLAIITLLGSTVVSSL